MKLTYIYHSGFFLELEKENLLFDYYEGRLPDHDCRQPLVVFASHSHPDHFSREIFQLAGNHSQVYYILSDDISSDQVPVELRDRCIFMGPYQEVQPEIPAVDMIIRTLKSNDEGVAFMAETEGKKIYHAGDLNNWWWDDGTPEDRDLEARYRAELQRIDGENFNVAFVPVDPRITGWWKGMEDFLDHCTGDVLVPMHGFGDHSMAGKLRERMERQGNEENTKRLLDVSHPGQQWEL